MISRITCPGPVQLTKFRYRLRIPKLVFTFGSLINVLCWTLACREQLHRSLDVLKFLHWNGWILHRDKQKRKLIGYVYFEQAVQMCSFSLFLRILSHTFLITVSFSIIFSGRTEGYVGNRRAASQNP